MLQRLNGGTQGTIEPVDFRPACFTAVIKRPGRLLGMQHKHAEMDVPQREKHSDSADEIVKMAVFLPPWLLHKKRSRSIPLANTPKAVRRQMLA